MFEKLKVRVAKRAMSLWPSELDEYDISKHEVFTSRRYLEADESERESIRLQSAQYRFDYESNGTFFADYFPDFDTSELAGKDLLDLGCFTGGRLVYWKKNYALGRASGIDIEQDYIEAGRSFARENLCEADFEVSYGESLPHADNSFDFIASFDVLEHVRDVGKTLAECARVLRPGGKILAVFPQFYQPLESHLGQVTKVPGLHLVFSRETIAGAYFETLDERGASADWYRHPGLSDWERLMTLNGITIRRFRELVDASGQWVLRSWSTEPILRQGRASRKLRYRLLSNLFVVAARLPYLEEVFLGRICCILEKRSL